MNVKKVHYLGMTITHLLNHRQATFPTIIKMYRFHFVTILMIMTRCTRYIIQCFPYFWRFNFYSHRPNIRLFPSQISVASTKELPITPPAGDQSTSTSSRVYTEPSRQPFQPLQVVTTKRPACWEIYPPRLQKTIGDVWTDLTSNKWWGRKLHKSRTFSVFMGQSLQYFDRFHFFF
jgi:hypothetical protein